MAGMRTILIFLGGGVKLLHGENEFLRGYRNDVIDPIISQLNSNEFAKQLFIAKDYSDLTRNVVKGKHQDVYNNYIVREAQVALFIIDGEIGNITKHEIDVAVASAKKYSHPIVYVYGKNVKDNDEVVEYLNQEGIYFQHFFDNRDLAAKIKIDLETSAYRIERRRFLSMWISLFMSLVLCSGIFWAFQSLSNTNENNNTIDYCSAQLYLMRYNDVNALTGTNIFTNKLLSSFMYEDSILSGDDVTVFPVIGNDSIVFTTHPYFRVKLHNRHRNTVVFVEAKLEIDKFVADTTVINGTFVPIEENPETNIVTIDGNNSEYLLKSFRQNVAYGETDDRYFFALVANTNCAFRMRVRAKSQLGDYLYSNYVYVNYFKQ